MGYWVGRTQDLRGAGHSTGCSIGLMEGNGRVRKKEELEGGKPE